MEMTHQQEIESSRVAGFGGSDAKMFLKIGQKGIGNLSNTDKKRIRVAKGIDPYVPNGKTAAMQRGHDFEDWVQESYEKIFMFYYDREPKVSKKIANNFDTFFHADFVVGRDTVYELKCTQSPDTAYNDYKAQIQWQMLVSDFNVKLLIFDANCQEFCKEHITEIECLPDTEIQNCLLKGISLLDYHWDDLDLTIGEDWEETDLLVWDKMEVVAFTDYLKQIKELEEQAEKQREKVLKFMQENSIKSLQSEFYSISLTPESTSKTFDKKKLFAENPNLKESDYLKESKKKAHITVKIK